MLKFALPSLRLKSPLPSTYYASPHPYLLLKSPLPSTYYTHNAPPLLTVVPLQRAQSCSSHQIYTKVAPSPLPIKLHATTLSCISSPFPLSSAKVRPPLSQAKVTPPLYLLRITPPLSPAKVTPPLYLLHTQRPTPANGGPSPACTKLLLPSDLHQSCALPTANC